VFAWGGLVAFAATGRTPFGSGPPEAIVHRILHEPPDLGSLAGDLRGVVESAMRKQPDERPSAAALLARLLGSNTPRADAAVVATRVVQRTWIGTGLWEREDQERLPAPGPARAPGPPARPASPAQPRGDGVLPLPAPAWTSKAQRGAARPPAASGTPQAAGRGPAAGSRGGKGPALPAAGDRSRRGVLADALPGGMGRDVLLVLAFAAVLLVALAANPNPTRRTLLVTAPLMLALAGAALLGTGRAVAGLVLGVVAFDLLSRNPVVRPLHLAAYGFVALTMAVAGHLAGQGRLWRPARAVLGLAAGYALLRRGSWPAR